MAVIWLASSRVGASTRPLGRAERRLASASRLTRGSENARVLPLPVLPRPSTSRPARLSGNVAAWIGKGLSMPRFSRTRRSGPRTPRSANVGVVVMQMMPFRAVSCTRAAPSHGTGEGYTSGEIAGRQHRSPREVLEPDAMVSVPRRAVVGPDDVGVEDSLAHQKVAKSASPAASATGTRALIRVPSVVCSVASIRPSLWTRATRSPRS